MINFQEEAAKKLAEKGAITKQQLKQVEAYRKLNIFSLHNELRALLYLSVTLFTGGIGILIYQNIDSSGHIVLLLILLVIIITCFYFCLKKAPQFQKTETAFSNSLFDYLVLLATILTCTFIGYLQFQYEVFGTQYALVTLIPAIICLGCAYYFDNKSVLTIGITGLAAFIGITAKPQMLLQWETFSVNTLGYTAVLFGFGLVVWTIYSDKIDLKKHFKLVFTTYSLHIISIACLSNSFDYYWFIFSLLLGASTFYFIRTSIKIQSISIYIFTILYGYFGFNFVLFNLIDKIDLFGKLFELFIILIPIYFILSIVGFIKLIKNFNK